MDIESVSTLFTGRIELRDGDPVIEVPEREVELGGLDIGEMYRIAVLPSQASRPEVDEASTTRSQQPTQQTNEVPVEEGEVIEVEIEDVGEKGDGIARVGPGYVVFIPDTEIGDRITARVDKVRDNFAFAEVVEEEPVKA